MGVENSLEDSVIRDIEKYVKNSKKIKEPFDSVGGFGSTVLAISSSSDLSDDNLLGKNAVENALVRQWLEFASLYLPHINQSPAVTDRVLKELNGVLSRQTFLVKNRRTIADVVFFYFLWNIMSSLSFQEKEQHLNLSRWFNTLQQDNRLRQSRKIVCFSRTLLY